VAAGAASRVAVVFNPVSGRGSAQQRELAIRGALDDASVDVLWLPTTAADSGEAAGRIAVADGRDLVIVAGGDGTVRGCASALAGSGVPLAVLPSGTGNLLARNLGIPRALPDAIQVAMTGQRHRIDVGSVTAGADSSTSFVIMAGLGFDAAMLRGTDGVTKRQHGSMAYVQSGLRELRYPQSQFALTLDGARPIKRRASCVLVANVGRIQGDIAVVPGARPDDGLLDVAVIRARTVSDWLQVAARITLRGRWGDVRVETFRAGSIQIESDAHHPLEYDGEVVYALCNQLSIQVQPAALTVCVPTRASRARARDTAPLR
jgi:YegS/Rv2252/BmrU family lipid kinase